jgi:hypothetical protein
MKYLTIYVNDPGFGSGLEDSDPLTDRILRPKDPDSDSVGFGFVPSPKLARAELFVYFLQGFARA